MTEARSAFVVGRAAATTAAVLAIALGCVRLIGSWLQDHVPVHDRSTLAYLHRASDAIAAASDKLGDAAAIGTSQTMFGFDPEVFDAGLAARGHPMTTLNFGIVPNPPSLARALVDNLCEAHRAAGTRFRLLLVELSTVEWTGNELERNDPKVISFGATIANMTRGPEALLRGPQAAADYLVGRALGYRAPFAIANSLTRSLYDLGPNGWKEPIATWFDAYRRFMDLYRPGDRGDWRAASRGFVRVDSPIMANALDEYVRLQNTAKSLARQQDDAADKGVIAMNIPPVEIARTINFVRELGGCPERVILVVYPFRPSVVSALKPEAVQRLHDALATIRRATGDDVIDLFDSDIDDFMDLGHMTPTRGAQRFSRILAARVADSLEHRN